jgi:hypothetical protein
MGEERVTIEVARRGASRLLTPPVTPRLIGGRSYIAIDMGTDSRRFSSARRGMAGLFNDRLGLDPRRLVGFVRNISLLTKDQIEAMPPPSAIPRFPAGLFQPGLLFSGVFEDGWIAERARFHLRRAGESRSVIVRGHAPGISERLRGIGISVLVDGEPVSRQRLEPGDFELRVSIPPATGARWVELHLDSADRLSADDERIVSILLRSIELEGGG